jgi:SAM-dependent methyltransferase
VAKIDVCDARDFAPYRACADTVICLNVLEHVADPDRALDNIRTALRPGGRAILLVPQGQWLYSNLDREIGHVKRYSREQLRLEIERAQLEVEQLFDFNRSSVPGWALNCKLVGRTRLPRAQLRLFDMLTPLVRRVDPWLPWPGLSLISVARKPGPGA